MRSLSLLYIQWDLSFRRQWWRALMYCLVCGMCVKSLTKARHATLCANWSDWTPAPPPDILEYQHSKLRLLWYLHSIDLSWDAASFRHSARLVQGKFWSVWQKYFKVGGYCGGERCGDGNDLSYIPHCWCKFIPITILQCCALVWPCKLGIVIPHYCIPVCCVLPVDVKVTVVEFVCVWMWGQTRLLWLELLPAQSSPHIWDRIR